MCSQTTALESNLGMEEKGTAILGENSIMSVFRYRYGEIKGNIERREVCVNRL